MAYNFDKTLKSGKWEVKIDTGACYGYYEHDDFGEGGGLWFQVSKNSTNGDSGRKLELTDFDGRHVLPKSVVSALREAGFIVDEIFD